MKPVVSILVLFRDFQSAADFHVKFEDAGYVTHSVTTEKDADYCLKFFEVRMLFVEADGYTDYIKKVRRRFPALNIVVYRHSHTSIVLLRNYIQDEVVHPSTYPEIKEVVGRYLYKFNLRAQRN